ncbi:MAG TPA: hypothetical protein VGF55_28435, partial [Gemmataceae bacterium]
MYSLLGLAWLAGSAAASDAPGPLHPLPGTGPAPDLRDPPPLVPAVKTALPEMPALKAAVPSKTLYYQKDAAPPPVMPAKYQNPAAGQPPAGPETTTLPASAINVIPPEISAIPLQTEAELRRSIVNEVVHGHQSEIFRNFPTDYEAVATTPYAPHVLAPAVERVEPT